MTHEYGHHVANTRRNDPWEGVDWGTKRWASYVNVCARSKSGELFPGDEGSAYTLNPGEAFAEDYRVLNERRAGLTESPWEVVDTRFYPDQAALDAVALDVTSPWVGATTSTYTGAFTRGATGRGFRVATPLDGDFTATLTSPSKARLTLRIVDPATGSVLAVDGSPLRTKTLSLAVCGQRTIQVQVRRVSGGGTSRSRSRGPSQSCVCRPRRRAVRWRRSPGVRLQALGVAGGRPAHGGPSSNPIGGETIRRHAASQPQRAAPAMSVAATERHGPTRGYHGLLPAPWPRG